MASTSEIEAKKKRDQSSKKMGQLLLQGWAMMADSCPDCFVPIMKNRKNNEEVCVICDKAYQNKKPAPVVQPIAQPQQIVEEQEEEEEESYEQMTERMLKEYE